MATDDLDPTAQPKGWSWRDRARGSVVRATILDPGAEPLDGVEAFPTAYVPDRLIVSDGGAGLPARNLDRLRAAAAVFGWGIVRERLDHSEFGDGKSPERRLPGAPILSLIHI